MLSLLLLHAPALAEGYSTDIELVRPAFSPGAIAGMDAPGFHPPGSVRVGTLLQYQRDPLLLYQLEREAGAVVSNRFVTHVGASIDFTRRISARVTLPLGGQWGSDVPALAGDTLAMGDAGLGMRVHLLELGPLDSAARVDVLLPFGTPGTYFGEAGPRGALGLLLEGRVGPLALLGDVGVLARAGVETEQDFSLGSELTLSGGARLDVWPDAVSLGAGVISRTGFAHFWTGGAETPVELVADLGVRVAPQWRLNAGVGRGVAAGYGTTQFRGFVGVTWERIPAPPGEPEPEPLARLLVTEAPDLPPEAFEPLEPEPEPEWAPTELARVEETQIVIRDPIQFELGTDRILPESIPTLHAIAKLLNEHPEIGHLVIEGHASEEGSFEYNYDLSIRRSLSIFRELILAGTYPARLSCRGMGEVEPVAQGSDEASLAKNRRVIFHIVRRLKAGDEPLPMKTELPAPWDGAPMTFTPLPPLPAPEPPPEVKPEPTRRTPPKKDEDVPDRDLFEERDEDEEAPR